MTGQKQDMLELKLHWLVDMTSHSDDDDDDEKFIHVLMYLADAHRGHNIKIK